MICFKRTQLHIAYPCFKEASRTPQIHPVLKAAPPGLFVIVETLDGDVGREVDYAFSFFAVVSVPSRSATSSSTTNPFKGPRKTDICPSSAIPIFSSSLCREVNKME